MKVIHSDEENHGHVGTAVSMKAAVQYLVDAEWITPQDRVLYQWLVGRTW